MEPEGVYVRLSKYLLRSRTTLLKACAALDIDPLAINLEELEVYACDNCSYWETPKTMLIESDGTRYCKACTDLQYLRF